MAAFTVGRSTVAGPDTLLGDADLPNLLTAAQATFTDVAATTVVSRFGTGTVTLNTDLAFALHGTTSLLLTKNATAGAMNMSAPFGVNAKPITPGTLAVATRIWLYSPTAARVFLVRAAFYDDAGVQVGTTIASGSITSALGGWTSNASDFTVPAGATRWTQELQISACAANEVHYADQWGAWEYPPGVTSSDRNTPDWSMPIASTAGTGSVTTGAPTVSGSASSSTTGTGGIGVVAPTVSGAATSRSTGTGSVITGAPTVSGAAVNPATATYVNTLDTVPAGTYGTFSIQSGALRLGHSTTPAAYSGWDASPVLSFTESTLATRITRAWTITSGEAMFGVYSSANINNRVTFGYNTTGYICSVSGVGATYPARSGDTSDTALRIRHSGSSIFFEASIDGGQTWPTLVATLAAPAWSLADVKLTFQSGWWDSTNTPDSSGYALFHGINTDLGAAASTTGTGSVSTGAPTVSGSGSSRTAGTGSVTTGAPAVSGAASSRTAGTGSVSTGAPTVAGSASSSSSGTGSVTAGSPTVAGSGVTRITGTGSVTTGVPTVAGSGSSSSAGFGAVTTGAPSVTGSGSSRTTGTGAVSTGAPTVAGTASTTGATTGTGAIAPGSPTMGGTATSRTTGTGAVPAPSPAVSGAAVSRSAGAGAISSGAPLAAGSGVSRAVGTGAVAAGTASVAGSAVLRVAGLGDLYVATPALLAGAATVTVFGLGSVSVDAPSVSGDQQPTTFIDITFEIGPSRLWVPVVVAPSRVDGAAAPSRLRSQVAAGESRRGDVSLGESRTSGSVAGSRTSGTVKPTRTDLLVGPNRSDRRN